MFTSFYYSVRLTALSTALFICQTWAGNILKIFQNFLMVFSRNCIFYELDILRSLLATSYLLSICQRGYDIKMSYLGNILQYSVRLTGLSSVYLSDVTWKVEEKGTISFALNIIISSSEPNKVILSLYICQIWDNIYERWRFSFVSHQLSLQK